MKARRRVLVVAPAWGAVVTVAAWTVGTIVWLVKGGSGSALWGPGGPDRASMALLVVSLVVTTTVAVSRGGRASQVEIALLGATGFVFAVVVVQVVRSWAAGPVTALSIGVDGLVWAFVNGGALVAFVVGLGSADWLDGIAVRSGREDAETPG